MKLFAILFLFNPTILFSQNDSLQILGKDNFEKIKGHYLKSDGFGGETIHLINQDSTYSTVHSCLGGGDNKPTKIEWLTNEFFIIQHFSRFDTMSVVQYKSELFLANYREIEKSISEFDSLLIKAGEINLMLNDPEFTISEDDIVAYLLFKNRYTRRKVE